MSEPAEDLKKKLEDLKRRKAELLQKKSIPKQPVPRKPISFVGKKKIPIYYQVNKQSEEYIRLKSAVKYRPSFMGKQIEVCQGCGCYVVGVFHSEAIIKACSNCINGSK